VSTSVISSRGGNTYNNFDTNTEVMYTYTPEAPEAARDKVMQLAGRVDGGDFQWKFNDAVDDTDYNVNDALKDALVNYKTSMVSVQGDDESGNDDGSDDDTGDDDDDDGSDSEITADVVHNFTESGMTSAYFSISGNLSDSKGTVSYAGLTLTQCLKIESSTLISFTTTKESELTLVFNNDYNGRIKINSSDHTITAGVLTKTLEAGSHEITKTDVANLYLISIDYDDDGDSGGDGDSGDDDNGDDDSGDDDTGDDGSDDDNDGSGDDNDDDNTDNGPADTTLLSTSPVSKLSLYPNPVSSFLTISTELDIEEIAVYTLTGQRVLLVVGNLTALDMSSLTKGSYIVIVNTGGGTFREVVFKR